MGESLDVAIDAVRGQDARSARATWRLSLPLALAVLAYGDVLLHAQKLLRDGDTYWHIAAGRWILAHGTVPSTDSFSATMGGAPWAAHEWLAEIVFALAHALGGWNAVVALTGVAFAAAVAILTRGLLRWLEPLYALLFGALAIGMSMTHVLARPHVLAMPLLVLWTLELARARDEGRAPRLLLIPLAVLWANVHGGFTLGLALGLAFAAEAVWSAWRAGGPLRAVARQWGLFLAMAIAASVLTPLGVRGLWFTWEVMANSTYALAVIGEWQSPNFQVLQPLSIWLMGGLALVLYQGLRLPALRLGLVLALLHLSLKHMRNIELLGLVVPLVIAAPFSAQWRARRGAGAQWNAGDELLGRLSRPAGAGALALTIALAGAVTVAAVRLHPIRLPGESAPIAAVEAAQRAGVRGVVLNTYDWGGYLIYSGIAPFIDGRADVYGDSFLRKYQEALQLAEPGALEQMLEQYHVGWTLLRPGTPANALLGRLPEWRLLYADDNAVVHMKNNPSRDRVEAPAAVR